MLRLKHIWPSSLLRYIEELCRKISEQTLKCKIEACLCLYMVYIISATFRLFIALKYSTSYFTLSLTLNAINMAVLKPLYCTFYVNVMIISLILMCSWL